MGNNAITWTQTLHPASITRLSRRTLWSAKVLRQGKDERYQVATLDEALLVSSLTTSGLHAPVLDIDMPVRVVSVEAGHDGKAKTEVAFDLPDRPWEHHGQVGADLGTAWMILFDAMEARGLVDNFLITKHGPPRFRFIVPVLVVPSSSAAHNHLYIEHEIDWDDYVYLLKLMQVAGIVEPGFVRYSIERGASFVLKPGLRKTDLAKLGVTVERWSSAEREDDVSDMTAAALVTEIDLAGAPDFELDDDATTWDVGGEA